MSSRVNRLVAVGVSILVIVSSKGVFSGPAAPFDCASEVNGNTTTEEALKNALLCGTGYNTHQRPVKNQQDRVAMYIGADVMNVELIHNSFAKLEITVEISMQWYDAYLHWNKKAQNNIQTLSVSEKDIWTPILSAKSLSKSPVQKVDHCYQVKCHLSSDGEVMYSMLCTFTVDCLDNSLHWAFETKDCPLRIFTPEYDINQLSLFHFQRRLSYSVAGVLPYKITSFQMAIVNNSVSPEFRMDIVVERMVGPHLVVFFILILILMTLNLMITWFRIDTTVRAVTSITSLALHAIYTVILYWYANTKMHPASCLANILLGSLIITIILIGVLVYSMNITKQSSMGVPHALQKCYQSVTKIAILKAFLKLGYLNINDQLIKPSKKSSSAGFSNHVDHIESTSKDTAIIEQTEDSEEGDVDPTKLKWNVLIQPFDRIIFCGIAIAYALMLLVLFLA
ncbi:neuronal acetylcholine receptor subunit alpha-4 isoform X2 [Aedes aegypti]|uniref:Neurotransmitter-gated ion-channel ligand-binding domain-containing protein n=1 Tax=Aedes aegypti TaxID=7159 RepID=A0A903U1G9_AEDAE|nr:neuronal acetylcholine receptor subunit alpha-4 isoform X2 [Aedes aegypti]